MNITNKILIIIVVLLGAWVFLLQQDIKKLRCDVANGFFVERNYVYPILREQGFEPDNYAQGIENPLTTSNDCE